MRRFLNLLILLVLVGAVLFVAWKANLLPNPFERKTVVDSSPTPTIAQRDNLRVAVPERPEKLILVNLQRLLQAENLAMEILPYNPQTVWLELANGELDLVIAPVDEAVKAQGRFQAGHFLFFSGLSQGLDQLIAWPDAQNMTRVAVRSQAATDFLARQMLPEATVIPAGSAQEVQAWLQGKAVEAAMIDISANDPAFAKPFKILSTTSLESPMPSVVVLSRSFAENAQAVEYTSRRDILVKAIESWTVLVGYLESQPELLKTTLKKEAHESGIDVDVLLSNYSFLSPHQGRLALMEFHSRDAFKTTLDLLVLSGVSNLVVPDWNSTVEAPAFLQTAWAAEQASLTPEATPSPQVDSPIVSLTPQASASPESELAATYSYPQTETTDPWPTPILEYATSKALNFAPALSTKQVAVAASDHLYLHGWGRESVKVPLASSPSTVPLSDGRNFFYAIDGKIASVNSQGKELWQQAVTGRPLGSPMMVGEKLVYGTDEGDKGRLICLDPLDGEILWEAALDSPLASGPVVASSLGRLLTITINQAGEVKAWNLDDGTELWTHSLEKPSLLNPAVGFGKLAVSQPEGKVRLISLQDGSQIWEADLGSPLVAPPTISENGVILPSKDTYLYMLSLADGSIAWKTRLSHTVSEPAVLLRDKIVQSDEAGKVHTLQLGDGTLLSSEEIGAGWLSRAVAWDGRWALLDASGKCRVYGKAEGP